MLTLKKEKTLVYNSYNFLDPQSQYGRISTVKNSGVYSMGSNSGFITYIL